MNGLNIKQLLSSKGKLIGSIVVILVIIIMCIILLLPKHLQGKYSHTTDMFLVTSTDTLRFDGSKVTEYTDGRKTNTGTYKLSGQKLEIEINGYSMIANLSDDKKTFTVESATGIADLAKGYKYTKSDE
ncbi:MAG: hypothetical protein ABF754_06250 [Leuconostoc pseudomesenteroides]|uniref:hypothetical protein n=1 Tax=Leuconostoc pseudomesenteroides TaxID=33968 RepID=UPI00111DA214|nr:hypothetical protein [Leuconostoc pseudomesenteroides]MCT4388704.1 hypothetical protein [Leuconostoc pseudomesenteroides]TOZ07974.1 hypothetical protein DIS14_00075 [Leuconostoc pseudomesenteroides]